MEQMFCYYLPHILEQALATDIEIVLWSMLPITTDTTH